MRELANGCGACGASRTYCECVQWVGAGFCCADCDGNNHREKLQLDTPGK